jgi:hypothetical protein
MHVFEFIYDTFLTASEMIMMMMITDESGRMINKPAIYYYKILIKHLAGGTVENHTKPSEDC